MSDPVIALRTARRDDAEFVWKVQWRALGAYVTAVFGSDRAEQRAYFDAHHDLSGSRIVTVDGVDAGHVCWQQRGDHWYLRDIALLPEYQGRGIGSSLLGRVLAKADAVAMPVRLRVLRSNGRARELYERFGFHVYEQSATHDLMVRPARTVPR